MARRTRRARVVLAVVAVALVGLGVWRGEALWLWATTKRVYIEVGPPGGPPQRGWKTVSRWSGKKHGRMVLFTLTGWKISEHRFVDGEQREITAWWIPVEPRGPYGQVFSQTWRDDSGTKDASGSGIRKKEKTSPPWLWGVTDQTEPSMPEWMKDDELWAKVPKEEEG